MLQTFATLPENIEKAISEVLSENTESEWVSRAKRLHERYMENTEGGKTFIHDLTDALAYLALRVPATYAQAFGALNATKELVENWKPTTVLDIGSGPGTAIWAAKEVWPSLEKAVCIDSDNNFLRIGETIALKAQLPLSISWSKGKVENGFGERSERYDVVVLGNLLNELPAIERENILEKAYDVCKGVVIVIEPGTPSGSSITSSAFKRFSSAGNLIAPYIGNSFVTDNSYYLHFSQRFNRPQFQKRVRQYMRNDLLSSSDVEDAKYSYTAFGKLSPKIQPWGRVVGNSKIQKGFLEIPVLTHDAISWIKVMKRNKQQYRFAKELKWGDLIQEKELIHPSP